MTCIVVICDRSHPIAGPMRNAMPKAAHINHIFLVRSSGLEMSEIYACITPKPAPPSHQISRAKRKIPNSGVKPEKIDARFESDMPVLSVDVIHAHDMPRVSDQTLTSIII